MSQRVLAAISIVIVAVLIIGVVAYMKMHPSQQLHNASVAPAIGKASMGGVAPQFTAATTNGLFDLSKTDRPVFLEVFATWCPHCQRETAVIDRLYKKYGAQVAFIAIPGSDTAMDGTSPSSQLDVLNFQQKFHAQYPIAEYDPALGIANLYLQGGFPTIAVIKKNKTISYLNSGEITYAELENEIRRVL